MDERTSARAIPDCSWSHDQQCMEIKRCTLHRAVDEKNGIRALAVRRIDFVGTLVHTVAERNIKEK
ncbi:hypothetical protein [Alkalicoccus chagannorensis]|uniref:hypothetical protein n=1 Tax=Alkalicoccus chagannorensis TaxID=427072 RepID=UPI0012ECA3F6|nr:hypothetical protein [Alkalicoccus chagannorensis]